MTSFSLSFCLQNVQAYRAALRATNLTSTNFNAYLTLARTYEALYQTDGREESVRSARNAFERGNSTQWLHSIDLATLYI